MLNRRSLVVLTLAASAAWCATPGMAADGPLKIGVILPMTGPASNYGGFIDLGMKVGVGQVNDAGGVNGRKIEIIVRDDASNSARTILAAKELLNEQKVDMLYLGVVSGTVMAALPYATEQKVLTISNGASPQIGDVSKFPYSFMYTDLATQRVPPVAAALKKLGGQKVGIMTSTNPPQVTFGEALNAQLASFGMQSVGYRQFGADAKDLTPQLQSLRDAGADIIVVSTGYRDHVRVVMQGMQTLGWKAKVVADPATIYGDLREQMPAALGNQFFAVNYRVGVRTAPPSDALKAAIAGMKAIRPIENLALSVLARDTIYLIKWAFETAQKEKGSVSNESLKAILESLGSRQLPPGYLLMYENPAYSAKDHTTSSASQKEFWGLVHVGPLVDGTYEGEALSLP